MHSLRIGGVSALAAMRVVSERVFRGEGLWKSDAYKVYTRNNTEDENFCESRNRVSKTTRPGYGLGQTASVANDLGS